MKTMQTTSGGYAVYDCPKALRAFLNARATGTATKETLRQLSDNAMAEMEERRAKLPKAQLIDFATARRERTEP